MELKEVGVAEFKFATSSVETATRSFQIRMRLGFGQLKRVTLMSDLCDELSLEFKDNGLVAEFQEAYYANTLKSRPQLEGLSIEFKS